MLDHLDLLLACSAGSAFQSVEHLKAACIFVNGVALMLRPTMFMKPDFVATDRVHFLMLKPAGHLTLFQGWLAR